MHLHGGQFGPVISEVDEQVIFCGFNALQILVVEIALDEGLIVIGVSNGAFIDGQHLSLETIYVIKVENVMLLATFSCFLLVKILSSAYALFLHGPSSHLIYFLWMGCVLWTLVGGWWNLASAFLI